MKQEPFDFSTFPKKTSPLGTSEMRTKAIFSNPAYDETHYVVQLDHN